MDPLGMLAAVGADLGLWLCLNRNANPGISMTNIFDNYIF
jgi:hypothetical protein